MTENIYDGLVFWDIPEGVWRIYFVIETRKTPDRFKNYIDILNPESCKLQIEAVYEKQYEHFEKYFGNTFAGFFSDEPSFGNDTYYDSKLGKKDLLLPWNDELSLIISEKIGISLLETRKLLPLLWAEHNDKMYHIRYIYMDVITMKYKTNFLDMLGNWCREHGVMYIGHVIEDMNAHMRTGYGAGHFFRAVSGQDISGCDAVLNQIIPGIKECLHTAPLLGKLSDLEFFSYTLAKLASSDSHIYKQKKGRAFCEIFGAFGWAEGIPMMKQLADHMLVSGINRFVPHAFNMKYPDLDCPPHFFVENKTPQFDIFCHLTKYMQKMSHVLSGGIHVANAAVLYNAEAEWCGGKYELFQKISKILSQNQIDFDFIPSDCLENAGISDKLLCINEEKYRCLIVSYSEVLPVNLMNSLQNAAEKGLEIIFCNDVPKRYAETDVMPPADKFTVLKKESVPDYLKKWDMCDIKPTVPFKYLRYYHIKREGKDIFMFLNEDIFNPIETEIESDFCGKYIEYNAWENRISYKNTENGKIKLKLNPSESTVIIFEEHDKPCETDEKFIVCPLETIWEISIEKNGIYEPFDKTDRLYNIAKKLPRYCGKIKYETTLKFEKLPKIIELGNVGEIAILYINGCKCTEAVNYPYRFDIVDKCKTGENTVVIEVITNLGYRERDDFSAFLSLPPSGIAGPVNLLF